MPVEADALEYGPWDLRLRCGKCGTYRDVVVSDELEIPVALDGNIVFKLIGTDQAGRRVSAWGSLDGSTPRRPSVFIR